MEQNYTKKLLKNGVPVRSIDLYLRELKNFYNLCSVDFDSFKNTKLNKSHLYNTGLPHKPELLFNFFKALKATDFICSSSVAFLPSDYNQLSAQQKGYLNELFVINFFLKHSYQWVLYRSKKYFAEVDLLFFYNNCYHLIEVKSNSSCGLSMGLISEKQKRRLKNSFSSLQNHFSPVRAHLISVDVPNSCFYIFFDFLS